MFKYGILGPTVNVAKRLESLTKPAQLNAPVLCCEHLSEDLRAGGFRTRRVGRVLLRGMTRVENVHELVDQAAPFEAGWEPTHDSIWDQALWHLESARAPADLREVEELREALPPQHPRSVWLGQQCRDLRVPQVMERWDGILRQSQ